MIRYPRVTIYQDRIAYIFRVEAPGWSEQALQYLNTLMQSFVGTLVTATTVPSIQNFLHTKIKIEIANGTIFEDPFTREVVIDRKALMGYPNGRY